MSIWCHHDRSYRLSPITQKDSQPATNLFLGEIEAVLGRQGGVRAAAVTVREDTPGDQRLVAYLIAEEDATLSAEQMRSWLREWLPAYMVPSVYVFIDTLPLSPSGKIDRNALPAPSRTVNRRPEEAVAPHGELEIMLARIWSELLGFDVRGKLFGQYLSVS